MSAAEAQALRRLRSLETIDDIADELAAYAAMLKAGDTRLLEHDWVDNWGGLLKSATRALRGAP